MAMIKYIVHLYTGYCGSDCYEALEVDDDTSEEELGYIVWDMAVSNAERFGYYPPYEGDEDDYEEDEDSVSNGIEGYAELYDPKKHDRYRPGGGSFAQDFSNE